MNRFVRSLRMAAIIGCALGCSACGINGSNDSSDPDILAVYNSGTVTISDFDEEMIALPPSLRQVPAEQAEQRNLDLVKSIVADRLLLEKARSDGYETLPGFLVVHEDNRQRLVADHYLQQQIGVIPEVTDDEVRDFFASHREESHQPPKALVSHIFRRCSSPEEREAAVVELGELRRRVTSGESFGALAREHSDSETARQDGSLGWLQRDSIPADLAEIVFALEPGVPSRPTVTKDGVHLFLVSSRTESRDYTLDEVRSHIVRLLANRRRQELISSVAAELPKPDPYFVVDHEGLGFALEGGDPEVEVFRIGPSSLDIGRLRVLIEASAASMGPGDPVLPQVLFDALVKRAHIYEHCRNVGLMSEPALAKRLEALLEEDLIGFARERVITEEAANDQERLEAFFESNRRRFDSPLMFDLKILAVDIPGRDTNEVLTRLNDVRGDQNGDRLERASVELDGRLETLAGATAGQLERWNPKAARFAVDMQAGECSKPFRIGDSVVVVEVVGRAEPAPLPYSVAADRVLRQYVADHRQELHGAWLERALLDVDFHLFTTRVAGLSAVPQPDQG